MRQICCEPNLYPFRKGRVGQNIDRSGCFFFALFAPWFPIF
nr:MAG TPA: hypothetical protein [Caudoviricetes sp.]